MPIPNGILCKIWADFTLESQPFLFLTVLKNQHKVYAKKQFSYLQPIITQYFIDNKSEIWLLFLIAHSKR